MTLIRIIPVINACKKLKGDGFTIALDDFIFNRTDCDYTPLIELADIIKIEFSTTNKTEQRKLINKYKSKITFLAEKVETREEYKEAVEMGYELFQGYFFSKPMMLKAKEIGHLNIHLVRILEELQREAPNYFYISDIIQKDLGLSYKLLKMANSIYYGGKYPINGIRQALYRLGTNEMSKWISIMLIREFEAPETSELVKMCLLRGKMLALMSFEINHELSESDFFLTGILSSVDIILNEKMEEILSSLGVTSVIKTALLEHKGQLYECLDCVLKYERFEFEGILAGLMKVNVTLEKYMDLYLEALLWLGTANE